MVKFDILINMIIGEYQNRIGEKKRVAVPKKIRTQIGKEIILTRGYEGSLVLVDKKMWTNIGKEIMNGSFINKNIRETTRFLVGSAVEVELDSQGRFVIPQTLHEYAGIKDDVTFVGLINWVEIWATEKWKIKIEEISKDSEKISEALTKQTIESGGKNE